MNNFEQEPNTTQKILAALAYISYFFLPVIFPLIVWIVGADKPFVKQNAKRAFWSQLLPVLCGIIFLIIIGLTGTFNYQTAWISWGWMTITCLAIVSLIALGSLIYNVAYAIRVLID